MNKPNGYNEAKAQNYGEFEKLPDGGYICRIVNAKETTSSTGKNMLEIYLDISEGQYMDYYNKQFNSNTRPDKRWGCIYRQLTEGDNTKYFKGMITAIEESNTGYKFDFNEKTLIGKRIGVVFGSEEYENQAKEIKMSTKPFFTRNIEKIKNGDFKIPEIKRLSKSGSVPNNPLNVERPPDLDDDDLPF